MPATPYVTDDELRLLCGLAPTVFDFFSIAQRTQFAQVASDRCDGDIGNVVKAPLPIPLPAGRMDLKLAVCHIAGYLMLGNYGFNPESAPDAIVVANYDRATAWLQRVAKGEIDLGQVDTTPETAEGGVYVATTVSRGW